MIVKTNAIVLRARKLRETSRFLTLYTEQFGKIDVVAKGVRQQNSKLRGVLEPFSEITAVLYRKEHRSAQYLSDAELLAPRRNLSGTYEKISAAFVVAELTDAVMHQEETNPAMYELLRDTLDALDRAEQGTACIVVEFQFRLIRVLGFDMVMDSCIRCNAPLASSAIRWFSPSDGGLRCGACGRTDVRGTKITPGAYNLLLSLGQPRAREVAPGTPCQPDAEQEVRGLLNAYILYHTESRVILRAGGMLTKAGRPVD